METKKELRKEQRKPFKGTIFYVSDQQLYEGEVKNYSASGIFVKTSGRFNVGQTLNLALPYSKEQDSKRLGSVIWQNTEGIGVELNEERDEF
ncbi:MAG: PilZ domain-containing protein [Deltaproteobacteria bacterium]|nr:PilZ domain-containing protein [Deltaproteobacteria bacterium]MBW2564218.1 PilZ domain-containing protein [Deltaproteobacteria bacterium]